MSKAVMMSIRPKWCEKIVNGEKTIEVRKTRPKLQTPFKCYIYCTMDHFYISVSCGEMDKLNYRTNTVCRCNGKVIGEFTCDRIYELETKARGGSYYVKNEDQPTTNFIARQSCLDLKDMHDYLHAQKGYGWHITDLRIYDAPRELSEFERPYECDECDAKWATECNACREEGKIKRAPQSWCYVEAMDNG